MSETDFSRFMPDVARELLGEPNKRLSSRTELRFGNHGSLSIDLEKGTWFDHEMEVGGGVLDLIAREQGTNANGGAVEWLRRHGYDVDDPARDPGFHQHAAATAHIVGKYDYVDEDGELLFQVVRFEPKTFRQRRKATAGDDPADVRDGWVWSVKGVRLVPFRLPELTEAVATERLVFVVEGEKDVLNLAAVGAPATCNPMGANKWPEGFHRFFSGADVVILPDNDEAGRAHADLVGASLLPVARRVRVLQLPGLPEKGDVSDWIEAGGTIDALYDLVETRARPWSPVDAKLHFEAVWFRDAESRLADPEWLVDDVITRGDFALIYGESQSGKSFLATHLGMAIARGVPFFDNKVLRQGGVIYVAAEGRKGFKKRLKAYRQHFGLHPDDDVPFVLVPVAIDMFGEEGDYPLFLADLRILSAQMRARGVQPELIVFDTHAAVSVGANENASEDVGRMLKHYERAQAAVGDAAVLIVHHKNAGGEKPRGHTSLYAAADNAIEVACDEYKNRTASIKKLKDGEDGGRIDFRLEFVEIGQRAEDGKTITSCVVEPADTGVRQKGKKGPKLTNQERIALTALREALIAQGEPAPAVLQLPYGINVVRAEAWKREFLRRGFNEPPNDNTFRAALKRVGDGLLAKGVIGRNEPYLWIAREPSLV